MPRPAACAAHGRPAPGCGFSSHLLVPEPAQPPRAAGTTPHVLTDVLSTFPVGTWSPSRCHHPTNSPANCIIKHLATDENVITQHPEPSPLLRPRARPSSLSHRDPPMPAPELGQALSSARAPPSVLTTLTTLALPCPIPRDTCPPLGRAQTAPEVGKRGEGALAGTVAFRAGNSQIHCCLGHWGGVGGIFSVERPACWWTN